MQASYLLKTGSDRARANKVSCASTGSALVFIENFDILYTIFFVLIFILIKP